MCFPLSPRTHVTVVLGRTLSTTEPPQHWTQGTVSPLEKQTGVPGPHRCPMILGGTLGVENVTPWRLRTCRFFKERCHVFSNQRPARPGSTCKPQFRLRSHRPTGTPPPPGLAGPLRTLETRAWPVRRVPPPERRQVLPLGLRMLAPCLDCPSKAACLCQRSGAPGELLPVGTTTVVGGFIAVVRGTAGGQGAGGGAREVWGGANGRAAR